MNKTNSVEILKTRSKQYCRTRIPEKFIGIKPKILPDKYLKKSFCIYGTGLKKTKFVAGIVKGLPNELKLIWIDFTEVTMILKIDFGYSYKIIRDFINHKGLLVIDGIVVNDMTEYDTRILYMIINLRVQNKCKTIITSDLGPKKFPKEISSILKSNFVCKNSNKKRGVHHGTT